MSYDAEAMSTQSNTPETDAVMRDPNRDGNDLPNLARTLERQRDAALAEARELRETLELLKTGLRLAASRFDTMDETGFAVDCIHAIKGPTLRAALDQARK